jgi:hypothetical protein
VEAAAAVEGAEVLGGHADIGHAEAADGHVVEVEADLEPIL